MKKRKSRPFLIIIIILLVAVLIAGAVCGYDMLKGSLAKDETVKLAPGDGTVAVAKELKEHKIIRFPKVFMVYAQIKGCDRQWKLGEYGIEAGSGYAQICRELTAGKPSGIKITIPEGKQLRQMAKLLEKAGICTADSFMEAATCHNFDFDFLAGTNPDCPNPLEGYLFPDTYWFEADTPVDEIINAMLANFEKKVYTADNIALAEEKGYSFNDIITLASVIESEATTTDDRKDVADVFYKRLSEPGFGSLQSCVTVEYAMGVKKSIISLADTKYDSPYNTYMYPGLPIGAICCPGLDSVEAALHPADNNYYYFQSDKNGKLYFASSWQEHAAIQKDVQSDWEGEVIEDYNQ